MQPRFDVEQFNAPASSAPSGAGEQSATPRKLRGILSLDDFETAARRHLPAPIFAYVSGGCETDKSLRGNREAFDGHRWVTRVLADTSRRTLATPLLGQTYAAPFGIAPMGISALSAYRGDLAQTRAAGAANIPAILSGTSLIAMEEVARANPQAWFQAYVPGEKERILKLLDRVEAAGFKTLVVTVDTPVSGNRENNIRAGFSTPLRPSLRLAWEGVTHPRWLLGTALRTLALHGMPHFENSQATRGAPILSSTVTRDFGARDHLSWEHLALIRQRWRGPLVVKGILHPQDALAARDAGADGVILSNHGGRQLDGSASPMQTLPHVVDAVGPDYAVMVDSGFRRGNDVLLALALGAKFVFVGRPFNYAGAVGGEAGIRHAIGILASEIQRNMALIGVSQVTELHPGLLVKHAA
ncbi:alpha-hydroxy acid oxidase [Acidovorax sp. MR-S7]|uniref:alpha-hydroxy acid oxidase n=1 Tax=Acidovorax sp. MR-S7 TaxID=1268622 RepID=UPI000361BC1F|nr:alpha-hydroxy acid oxidase [Acidovorax sp. MR-S7]GAD21726.1 L-lactate dehydrogenase (FMN-dependent) and related alpha-hydroxy acid dehydrogenase [Acidovorax sp. MR-S7]